MGIFTICFLVIVNIEGHSAGEEFKIVFGTVLSSINVNYYRGKNASQGHLNFMQHLPKWIMDVELELSTKY